MMQFGLLKGETMREYKVGVIRVLTTEDEELLNLHGKLLEQYYPMFRTVSRCIPEQYEGIHDEETEKIAIPKIVALAKEMADDGCEAIIISCADDPAVNECREAVSVPVIGGGRSTAALAMYYGDKPAGIGITDFLPVGYEAVFRDRLVGYTKGEGVESTLSLMTDEGYEASRRAVSSEKEKGADVIALCCTGMSTVGIRKSLEQDLGLPIMDPVMSEGLITLYELLRREYK